MAACCQPQPPLIINRGWSGLTPSFGMKEATYHCRMTEAAAVATKRQGCGTGGGMRAQGWQN